MPLEFGGIGGIIGCEGSESGGVNNEIIALFVLRQATG
jgi:hypothetical protein